MLRVLFILALIFGIYYVGKILVKRFLDKKVSEIFGGTFNSAPKGKKDEVLFQEDDIVVLKGEAKRKEEQKANSGE